MTPFSVLILFAALVAATVWPPSQGVQPYLQRRHHGPQTVLVPRASSPKKSGSLSGSNDRSEARPGSQMQLTSSSSQTNAKQRQGPVLNTQFSGPSVADSRAGLSRSIGIFPKAPSGQKPTSQKSLMSNYARSGEMRGALAYSGGMAAVGGLAVMGGIAAGAAPGIGSAIAAGGAMASTGLAAYTTYRALNDEYKANRAQRQTKKNT